MSGRKGHFTPEEDDVIRAVYPTRGPQACARMLDRTACSCQNRARKLGVRSRTCRRERWTEQEERYCLSMIVRLSRVTGHTPLGIIRHVEWLIRSRQEG